MPRALVIGLALVLAACGGGEPPAPTLERQPGPPRSPDAGIPEGHAAAEARMVHCRATHPPRYWDECARQAR